MVIHETIKYDKNIPAKIRLRDGPVDSCRGKPHWHRETQLIYVDSGKITVSAGSQKRVLGGGDVVIINPNEEHSLKGTARFLSVHLSYAFVSKFFDSVENYSCEVREESQEKREITVLLQKLLAIEQNTFDEYSDLMKFSVLMKIIRILLVRCLKEKQASVFRSGRTLESDAFAVKSFIEENYRKKILIAEVAGQINHKPEGFTPYFKELTGKCFTDYLCGVRVRHALDDYLSHDISVGEAAIRNGFGHYNHFTKACHKYYGASPTEIKKQKRAASVAGLLEKTA